MVLKNVAHREELVGVGGTEVRIDAFGKKWSWDPNDTDCWPVVFEWSKDIDILMRTHFAPGTMRTCVQAGGNFGVWPWFLSFHFDTVYTFEPDPRCFPHLVRNCGTRRNIVFNQAALDEERRMIRMLSLDGEESNLGAQFMSSGQGSYVPTYRIDDLQLVDCDLIYLDIEGAELPALRSGVETISRCSPVIVVEDKGLSEKFGYKKGDIATWLSEFGYQVAGMLHRDVILVPK